MGIKSNSSTESYFNFFGASGKDGVNASPVPVPFSGTGGEVADGVEPGNGYRYHYWKSDGTFVVAPAYGIEVDIDI